MKPVLYLLALFVWSSHALAGDFVRTKDGIVIHPDAAFSGGVQSVQLTVIDKQIIQVTAIPDDKAQIMPSLIISGRKKNVPFTVTEIQQVVRLKTSVLIAEADLQTGAVRFYDTGGKLILAEKQSGRTVQPQLFNGQKLYSVRQDFITSLDDAWYGLGQHQDGLMNYRGYQVQLFQNNTEVAVPLLVSRKNYGLLWDNYSLTQFGDVRPYKPLSSLKLYSKQGEQGWLTATYSNDKNKPDAVTLQRPEDRIDFEFLGDSKLYLPATFKPENGIATWEGKIASDWAGVHKMRFTYAGYLKVWINDQLILDRFRQNWNPGSAIIDVDLQSGKQYTFKAQWIPYGGESYLSCKWLPPIPTVDQNGYSFASEAGQQLSYYFIYGSNADEVISGYRQLTGKATILPRWAFGFWQSRERYKTQEEILSTMAAFRSRKIPIDNIVQDWFYWRENQWGSQEFDPTRFPSPDSMIRTLHEKYHAHFMISAWPKFYEGVSNYNEFNKKGWLYTRNIADSVRDWVGPGYHSTFYDVFNTDARKGFWDLLNKHLYSKGVDAWWMDASEPDILSNVSPQRRKEQMTPTALGASAFVLNAYPMLNAKGIYEGQRATNPNSRVFILTRSAFAGSQSYAAATWSGDIAARWDDLKAQISAGTNFSMSGIPYWTMDIGGFAVEGRYEHPNAADLEEWREQNTRWYQFGAFVPLFRAHGQFPYREVFHIAPEDHPAYQSIVYYDRLRYRLLPYIYSLAGDAYHQDGTIMRGLAMDFPFDDTASSVNDAYLFGPSLLINPVYQYKARARSLYLPKGTGWYDLYTGSYAQGGKRMIVDAPYERMPVFVKEGSIIPMGPDLQYTSEKPADTLTLFIYTGRSGSFNLYEDEGVNYNYEKGAFSTIPIRYNEATKTVTIGKREGRFTGMLSRRAFRIVWITKDRPAGIDRLPAADKVYSYEGQSISVPKQ